MMNWLNSLATGQQIILILISVLLFGIIFITLDVLITDKVCKKRNKQVRKNILDLNKLKRQECEIQQEIDFKVNLKGVR